MEAWCFWALDDLSLRFFNEQGFTQHASDDFRTLLLHTPAVLLHKPGSLQWLWSVPVNAHIAPSTQENCFLNQQSESRLKDFPCGSTLSLVCHGPVERICSIPDLGQPELLLGRIIRHHWTTIHRKPLALRAESVTLYSWPCTICFWLCLITWLNLIEVSCKNLSKTPGGPKGLIPWLVNTFPAWVSSLTLQSAAKLYEGRIIL